MYEIKTKQNDADVLDFLKKFEKEERYPDLLQLLDILTEISGYPAKMWGNSIIGYGTYTYQGKASSGEWFFIGFSPRKANISIYAISGFEKEKELMAKLGKYKTGKSCLYINRLSDIELDILKEFLKRSMEVMKDW
ncbi:MAG: DUF1801 domain-containing protein [Flavobacteriaceae bacterium]|nr:DUF1801 domain-containing protein [Flavobacteriaceae bacterium]